MHWAVCADSSHYATKTYCKVKFEKEISNLSLAVSQVASITWDQRLFCVADSSLNLVGVWMHDMAFSLAVIEYQAPH